MKVQDMSVAYAENSEVDSWHPSHAIWQDIPFPADAKTGEDGAMKGNHAPERLTVTVPEMAQMLGIGEKLTRRLIKERGIPHVMLGHQIRIPKRALDMWLDRESGIRREDICF